jgi:hypothetical protein
MREDQADQLIAAINHLGLLIEHKPLPDTTQLEELARQVIVERSDK